MEFSIGERKYRVDELGAREQLHIAKRIGPIMSNAMYQAAKMDKDVLAKLSPEEVKAVMSMPIMQALGDMSDADLDYVIDACCGAVKRCDGDKWFAIMNGGHFMYADLGPGDLMLITANVIKAKMENFTAALGEAFQVLSPTNPGQTT